MGKGVFHTLVPIVWKYCGHIPQTICSILTITKPIYPNAVVDNILHVFKCNNTAKKGLDIATRHLILSVAFHNCAFQETGSTAWNISQLTGIHNDALKPCISNETPLRDVRFKHYKKQTQSNSWEKRAVC